MTIYMRMSFLQFIVICMISTNQIESYSTLVPMLDTELKMNQYAGTYIDQIASSIWKIERGIDKLISAKWSHMDKEDYIGTPLTAMVMVRRLAQDWPPLATMVGRFSKLKHLQLGSVRWPTRTDFEVAARAMMRSQMTYDLNTALLVRGVQSDTFLTNVTAADCLEIARQYFKKELFSDAKDWLQHALSGIHDIDDASFQQTILYYMAAALCFSDDAKGSGNILHEILTEDPSSKPPEDLASYYSFMVTRGCLYPKGGIDLSLDRRHNQADSISFYRNNAGAEKHSRLCRGGGKVDSRLRCLYVHYHQPHLRIQPFKVEELQLDPPVIRFYHLVSDKEAESLIREGKKLMGPATVGTGGQRRVSEYRTSHVAWLHTDSDDWLARRISEATRLDTDYAEAHQVSRYSVSGEYLPHTDHFNFKEDWAKDRIATLMFYLNEVEQGGNTIFTLWNLSVVPVKNSAVLWFNFKPSGKGDDMSEHSGCPVLKGTKWVLNKWIHNAGNSVNFPCTLDRHGSFKGFYL